MCASAVVLHLELPTLLELRAPARQGKRESLDEALERVAKALGDPTAVEKLEAKRAGAAMGVALAAGAAAAAEAAAAAAAGAHGHSHVAMSAQEQVSLSLMHGRMPTAEEHRALLLEV